MNKRKNKIPVLLKLKRLKNSETAEKINSFVSLIKPPREYRGKPKRILLIRNDRIGDAVVTLPVIRNLKLNNPELKIDILVSSRNKFVLDDFKYADDIIEFNPAPEYKSKLYELPVLGGFLQFIRFSLIPFFVSGSYRQKIKLLRAKKYDAAVDLVGLYRNTILSRLISNFSVGPRKFITHIAYDYYMDSNWVSGKDNDFMTIKIEKAIENSLGLSFEKKDTSLPLLEIEFPKQSGDAYDIVFHLGSSKLRKLSFEKEKKLIEYISDLKVLVTDSYETPNYINLKSDFSINPNVEFKIFGSLREAAADCRKSKLLICYDGGQAHYLSQFVRTLVIFGPGSVELWKPYEFSGYSLIEESANGVQLIRSNGTFGHLAVFLPIWCRPCFDIGCREKPCLSQINSEFLRDIIKKYCFESN